LGITYRDLQLLPPPDCVPDGKWVGRIGKKKVTLLLTRQDEHANVNGHHVPQIVAQAVMAIEDGLSSDRVRRSQQVIDRLKIMVRKITEECEFAQDISKAVHIDVQLEEIEVDSYGGD
jgi:hypothetical protein